MTVRDGRTWRLAARRMGLNYRSVGRTADGFGRQVARWRAESVLPRQQIATLELSVAELTEVVWQVLLACARGEREGDSFEVFADGDVEGYGVLLGLLDRELTGEEMMAAFLRDVVADNMPFLHTRAEFEIVQAFYIGQARVIAELSRAEQRLEQVNELAWFESLGVAILVNIGYYD